MTIKLQHTHILGVHTYFCTGALAAPLRAYSVSTVLYKYEQDKHRCTQTVGTRGVQTTALRGLQRISVAMQSRLKRISL
jgi:hypothetical protein